MMKKRELLTGLALLPWATPALAQEYPSRPIRLLVGFAAGGSTDVFARAIAPRLQALLVLQAACGLRAWLLCLRTCATAKPRALPTSLVNSRLLLKSLLLKLCRHGRSQHCSRSRVTANGI